MDSLFDQYRLSGWCVRLRVLLSILELVEEGFDHQAAERTAIMGMCGP